MNKYATKIMRRWQQLAPSSFAMIEDKTEFFTTLGQEVEQKIDALLPSLESNLPQTEDYLLQVGQRKTALTTAEEVALSQVPWPAPEMSEAEAREEWAMAGPSEDNLWSQWVMDPESLAENAQTWAEEYLLPEEWIRQLASMEDATSMWDQAAVMRAEANEARYQRWKQAGYPAL